MGNAYLYGNGGSIGGSLGFEIVGGAIRPARPSQNMVWVNTDVDITSYVFSATAPENPVEGMLWVTIADSSNTKSVFTVGKEWVTVYTVSTKQYIGGAWIDKTAMNYQNGEWADWIVWLYNRGSIGMAGAPTLSTDYAGCKLTFEATYFSLWYGGNRYMRALFPEVVNFKPFSTMKVIFSVPIEWEYENMIQFGVDSSSLTSAVHTSQALNTYEANKEYTLTLDISSYDKATAPWVGIDGTTDQGEEKYLYIHEFVLE